MYTQSEFFTSLENVEDLVTWIWPLCKASQLLPTAKGVNFPQVHLYAFINLGYLPGPMDI